MSKKFRNWFYFVTLLIIAEGFLIWGFCQIDFAGKEIESISFRSYLKLEKKQLEIEQPKLEQPETVPQFVNLDIPFISQAPYAVWDELHNHTCEEAAIIMVYYYLTKKELTKEIVEQEILNMVDWQIKNWGGHFDLDVEQIVELFKNYYGSTSLTTSGYQNIELIYNFTMEDIKKELAEGNPIIVPAAGRLLKNLYFTPPGPVYHNLVIKGYDDKKSEWIVNDPGTRRGADFRYSYSVLESAVHDFNSGDVLNGERVMIVINNDQNK